MTRTSTALVAAALAALGVPASANNLGENGAWQFRSASDLASMASALDVVSRHQGGGYSAPTFTTNIARQFNCGVSASALGNSGGQSALANSPTLSGASASAGANASDAALGGSGAGTASSAQDNSGAVSSGVTGSTDTAITGAPSLALNSVQSNTGSQTAGVSGSSACSFGTLN